MTELMHMPNNLSYYMAGMKVWQEALKNQAAQSESLIVLGLLYN